MKSSHFFLRGGGSGGGKGGEGRKDKNNERTRTNGGGRGGDASGNLDAFKASADVIHGGAGCRILSPAIADQTAKLLGPVVRQWPSIASSNLPSTNPVE